MARFENAHGLWTGDAFGNEWPLAWELIDCREEGGGFEVYTDDGKGNGDFIAQFDDRSAAEQLCEQLRSAQSYAEVYAIETGQA